jgi:glycosyltransferase involved in cell wall biosynthesis
VLKKNVCFDNQIFLLQKNGGISRVIESLMLGLDESSEWAVHVHDVNKKRNPRNEISLGIMSRISSIIHWLVFKPCKDSIYIPSFYLPNLVRKKHPNQITIVHDMIPESWDLSGMRQKFSHVLKYSYCQKALRVVCVSQATARDLVAKWPEFHDKICVVNPKSNLVTQKIPAGLVRKQFQLIYVGKRSGYKNALVLIHALSELPKDFTLSFLGGERVSRKEKKLIAKLGLGDRVKFTRHCDDNYLIEQYCSATALLVSSLKEGFGLPIIEGLHFGIRVVCSDIEVFREVAPPGSVLFVSNPLVPKNWASSLESQILPPVGVVTSPARRPFPQEDKLDNVLQEVYLESLGFEN